MSEKAKLSPEEYRKILDGVELINISLTESKTFVKSDSKPPSELEIKLSNHGEFALHDDNVIDVRQCFHLDARKPKSKSRYVQIDATFMVSLSSKEPFTQEFFEIYKEVSLQLNTWPFFREFVHSATARMNIPPLTLPLLKR